MAVLTPPFAFCYPILSLGWPYLSIVILNFTKKHYFFLPILTPSLLLSWVIFWLTPSPPVLYSILSYNLHPLLFEKTQYFQAFVNPMIEINSITKSLFNIFSFVKLINICNFLFILKMWSPPASPQHTVSCPCDLHVRRFAHI